MHPWSHIHASMNINMHEHMHKLMSIHMDTHKHKCTCYRNGHTQAKMYMFMHT